MLNTDAVEEQPISSFEATQWQPVKRKDENYEPWYEDPETGAHFEYAKLCHRLQEVQREWFFTNKKTLARQIPNFHSAKGNSQIQLNST